VLEEARDFAAVDAAMIDASVIGGEALEQVFVSVRKPGVTRRSFQISTTNLEAGECAEIHAAAGASNQWNDWRGDEIDTGIGEGSGFRAAVHVVKTRLAASWRSAPARMSALGSTAKTSQPKSRNRRERMPVPEPISAMREFASRLHSAASHDVTAGG